MTAVEIRKLRKTFGQKIALTDVSLKVNQGEIFGFIGPNGAGKSTTIRCLMNFIRPTAGSISLLGKDAQQDGVELKTVVSYLSADSTLYMNWSGKEHVDFICRVRGISPEYAKKLAKRLEYDGKTKVHQLSSGNKQKLNLILALMTQPKLLILDEPTRGLDPLLQQVFQDIMREYAASGGTVFMSSHNLPEVEQICTNIAVIREGKSVINETIETLKAKSAHAIKVVFRTKPNPSVLKQAGAKDISVSNGVTMFKVQGDLNPVLHYITSHGVQDLEISHASLEELFSELYQ